MTTAAQPYKQTIWIKWLWITALVVLLDQTSKQLMTSHFQFGHTQSILPFLNLYLAPNSGAAFSFLNDAGGWQIILFSAMAIIITIILFLWLLKLGPKEKLTAISLCLVMGGAIGNLIDRLHQGYVIDFIDFHIKYWHFATFNIADAAVSIGALLLVLSTLFTKPNLHQTKHS